jgi:hypothetical protein
MEQTGCSKTLAHKIQMPGNYLEESKQQGLYKSHTPGQMARLYFGVMLLVLGKKIWSKMQEQRLVSEEFCAEIERYFCNTLMPVYETLLHISKHFIQVTLIGQHARDDAPCRSVSAAMCRCFIFVSV